MTLVATAAVLAAILPSAQAPWQASRCTGHEQITFLSQREIRRRYGPEVVGATRLADPTCIVYIDRSLPPAHKCAVLTHELGHLAGMPHSTNPESVMFPLLLRIPRRCRQFL